MSENAFRSLMQRLRSGDQAAAEEVHQRYGDHLLRVIRVRFTDPDLRRQMDSADICQSVFGNFFLRMSLGQYDELSKPDELLRLLTTMAKNRVIHHVKKTHADKRDSRRTTGADIGEMQLPAEAETPSQIVAWRELAEKIVDRLSDDERRIAEQRCTQRSWDEIAADFGTTGEAIRKRYERSIQRVSQELGIGDEFIL